MVKRGENITFPIDHDTISGKEVDVTVTLGNTLTSTLIAQLTCSNGICELDRMTPGRLIVYENGNLIKMSSSRSDEGIYEISYTGSSLKTNETKKYFNATVIDDGKYDVTILLIFF